MRKRFLVILAAFFCLSVGYSFASEKPVVQSETKLKGFTFNDAVAESSDAELVLLKSDKEKKEIKQNGFFDWLIKSEKGLLIGAIACTVGYGVVLITGAILMGVGSTNLILGVYYAGGAIFGLSWLCFLGAGVFWAFWGIAQYLKKHDYQATAFAKPVYNEVEPCSSSKSFSVGLSVSFH